MRWVLRPPLALASRSTRQGLTRRSLPAWTAHVSPRNLPLSIRHWSNDHDVVRECLPVVHRPRARARVLGPTNPPRITLAAEPSGFRWWGFAPHFSVTHSGIRTRARSTAACAPASAQARRSPTMRGCPRILSFGTILCPAGLSAHRHSTSELLRTLSRVAASKPTSWLSGQRHILYHSAWISGP